MDRTLTFSETSAKGDGNAQVKAFVRWSWGYYLGKCQFLVSSYFAGSLAWIWGRESMRGTKNGQSRVRCDINLPIN